MSTTTVPTVDQTVRDWLASDPPAMSLDELRDKIAQLVNDHPDVETVTVARRGKKGAGTIAAFAADGRRIGTVHVRVNGHVDPMPGAGTPADVDAAIAAGNPTDPRGETPTTIADVLAGVGIPGRAITAALKEVDVDGAVPPLDATIERAGKVPPGLSGKAAAIYVLTGKTGKQQGDEAKAAREAAARVEKSKTRRRGNASDRGIAIAAAAKELGGPDFKTPIGSTQADRVIETLGRKKPLDVLGVSERTLRAFAVKGEKPTPELRDAVRAFAAKTDDRLIWGRKLGLILLAIHREA